MNGPLKARFKKGDFEVELEGAREDVDHVLAEWWAKVNSIHPASGAAAPATTLAHASRNRSEPVTNVANQIKELPEFASFESGILQRRDFLKKIEGVLVLSNRALAPGEIARILNELGAKADPRNVSKYISNFKGHFLKVADINGSGKYKLTSKARADYLKEP